MARETGRNRDFVDKARQFASTYTPKQFEELCRLRRADGTPLGISLVLTLLKVTDKRERLKIQRQAVKEGWSKRRLELEVAKVASERPSSGGRRPIRASTEEEALLQIVQRTEQWNRWVAGLASDEEDNVTLDDLPKTVRDQLIAVSNEFKKLKATAENERKRQKKKK